MSTIRIRITLPDGSENIIVSCPEFAEANWPGAWEQVEDAPAPETVDPAQWLIDIGPFFDRFGAAKLAVLASDDAMVRALVADLQVRKWIDLQRPDVAQGIDLLIAKNVQGVNAALKKTILETPVAAEENLALRRAYFS